MLRRTFVQLASCALVVPNVLKESDVEYMIRNGFTSHIGFTVDLEYNEHGCASKQEWHKKPGINFSHIIGYMKPDPDAFRPWDKMKSDEKTDDPSYGANIHLHNGEVSIEWAYTKMGNTDYIQDALDKLDNLPSGKPKRVEGKYDRFQQRYNKDTTKLDKRTINYAG